MAHDSHVPIPVAQKLQFVLPQLLCKSTPKPTTAKKKKRKVEAESMNKVSINACWDTIIKNMHTKRP